MNYEFPVTNKFQAREVTEPDFEIEPDSPAYVNLDNIRGREFLDKICFNLNIDEHKLETLTDNYLKIIFSGHKGSGKTLELKRLHNYLDEPQRYFSVLIEIEKEFELSKFKSEYLFVAVISKLIAKLQENNIEFDSAYLNDIAKEWTSDKEIQEELNDYYQLDISSEASVGLKLFNFFGLKSGLKALFTADSKTSEVIRQHIRREPMKLISKFNQVLNELRDHLRANGFGQDILFIVDGLEKIHPEINQQLFINDAHSIKGINANMVLVVPIYSFFAIEKNPAQSFTHHEILPMIRLDHGPKKDFAAIIKKRIDTAKFFNNEQVLMKLVDHSGGSPRQLVRLVNLAINYSYGKTITDEIAQKAIDEAGRFIYEMLDSKHIEVIQNKDYYHSDDPTLDLLFSLAVIKYNGKRELNPLLYRFFN